jgi:hypothetical protein
VSFDHWWIGFFVDEGACEHFKPNFAAAAEKAVLSAESQQALAAWRNRPSDFEQDAALSGEVAAQTNAFIWAFNLPGFDDLAAALLTRGDDFAELCTEQNLFRMVIAARHTPVSILWHALGGECPSHLPGRMGNLLLHPREVEAAFERTLCAYAGTSPQNLIEAARRYCGWSVSDDTLRDVVSFLPDGLSRAMERQTGFLALARPQI